MNRGIGGNWFEPEGMIGGLTPAKMGMNEEGGGIPGGKWLKLGIGTFIGDGTNPAAWGGGGKYGFAPVEGAVVVWVAGLAGLNIAVIEMGGGIIGISNGAPVPGIGAFGDASVLATGDGFCSTRGGECE